MSTVNNTDVQGCVTGAFAELSQFVGLLHKHLGSQLAYDILSNIPSGIIEREMMAKHTLRFALVAAIGEYLRWDTAQVTRFAGEILEDSNLHYLAGLLFEHVESGQ
jgi:hypothetical protein